MMLLVESNNLIYYVHTKYVDIDCTYTKREKNSRRFI
jgi:hypothetical protein